MPRTPVLDRPRVSTHQPILDPAVPGTCWCGLPFNRRNARHQVDEDLLAEQSAAQRARYGDRD